MRIFAGFVIAALTGASASAQILEPSPPPLPWHVNAYIGFERAQGFESAEAKERWYYRNSLQIEGTHLKLHKQTVVCSSNRLLSTEGDGGASFYEGEIQAAPEGGVAVLRYAGCDQCLQPPTGQVAPESIRLPIHMESPDVVRLGAVTYSRKLKPYPDRCPADAE